MGLLNDKVQDKNVKKSKEESLLEEESLLDNVSDEEELEKEPEKELEESEVEETLEEKPLEKEEKEVVKEETANEEKEVEDDIQDIDLSETRKRRFRLDKDNNRILELDISDLNVLVRLRDILPELEKLAEDAQKKMANLDEDNFLDDVSDKLIEIDKQMRDLLDKLFDSNVSEVCAPNGSMYSPYGGKYRFEYIIDKLSDLYETNLAKEFNEISQKVSKYTDKYTKN